MRPKILLLVHPYFRPDRKGPPRSASERHVWLGLRRLGFACSISTAQNSLRGLDRDLTRERPDVVFNLLEEFEDEGVFDFHPVSYLESMGVPYTGCNPQGLIGSRNKFWVCQVARSAGVSVPDTWLADDLPCDPGVFPLFLKFNSEHASLGITARNLVRTPAALKKRLLELREFHRDDILVQKFIAGREYNVSVWGNRRPEVLPPGELYLGSDLNFATERIKFSRKVQRRKWILARDYRGDSQLAQKMGEAARTMFLQLNMSGYARFDFRVTKAGRAYLIDVNANPNLSRTEDFSLAARRQGVDYGGVLRKIINLGRQYRPRSV